MMMITRLKLNIDQLVGAAGPVLMKVVYPDMQLNSCDAEANTCRSSQCLGSWKSLDVASID